MDDSNHNAIGIEPILNGSMGNLGCLIISAEEEEDVDFNKRN